MQLNMGQEEFNLLGISAGLGTLNLAVGSSAFILTPKPRKEQPVQSSLKGRVHIRFGGSISIV